jgi:hypothetical protein
MPATALVTEWFAVFVGYGDGFAFSGHEVAGGAGSFEENSEAFGCGLIGRVQVGWLDRCA